MLTTLPRLPSSTCRVLPTKKLRVSIARLVVNCQQRPPRRLVPFILTLPRRLELKLSSSLPALLLWTGSSTGLGYYVGSVLTTTLGMLPVNDILAAMVTLLFYEAVSRAFYLSPTKPMRLWMANFFKAGLAAALLADAVKLGG